METSSTKTPNSLPSGSMVKATARATLTLAQLILWIAATPILLLIFVQMVISNIHVSMMRASF